MLTGLVDRFGRTQTFHREAAGEFTGEITGVTDGAGRQFRLVLTTQAQRAENARRRPSPQERKDRISRIHCRTIRSMAGITVSACQGCG
ncbi:YD repeat protein [Escherichia coli 3006]|nr:YD repeat protein [Escherichia coli 3006]